MSIVVFWIVNVDFVDEVFLNLYLVNCIFVFGVILIDCFVENEMFLIKYFFWKWIVLYDIVILSFLLKVVKLVFKILLDFKYNVYLGLVLVLVGCLKYGMLGIIYFLVVRRIIFFFELFSLFFIR